MLSDEQIWYLKANLENEDAWNGGNVAERNWVTTLRTSALELISDLVAAREASLRAVGELNVAKNYAEMVQRWNDDRSRNESKEPKTLKEEHAAKAVVSIEAAKQILIRTWDVLTAHEVRLQNQEQFAMVTAGRCCQEMTVESTSVHCPKHGRYQIGKQL